MLDVLVRVSGSEEVRNNTWVKAKARNALSYVAQFEFGLVEDEALREEGYKHLLQLSYSGRLVRSLLADAQLPVWSLNRPKTLIWLVEDSAEYGKRMLTYDADNPLVKGLAQAINYRGLPVSYPLLDFDDQLALGAERLWALDEAAIMDASERYKADVILVGKYSTTSLGQVLSSWQYFHNNRTRVYDLRAEEASEVGYQAILPLADFLASLYSFSSSADSEYFSLSVIDVENFADYRGLVSTLNSFDTIKDVKIDRVAHDKIELRLKSEVSLEQVSKQIALARKLFVVQANEHLNTPKWERPELGSQENPLVYRWRR